MSDKKEIYIFKMGHDNKGSAPDKGGITACIVRLLGNYEKKGLSPSKINGGYCHDFAYALVNQIPGSEVWESDPDEDNPKSPVHAFVKIGPLYYDSESINGVRDWKELNTFKKWFNSGKGKK